MPAKGNPHKLHKVRWGHYVVRIPTMMIHNVSSKLERMTSTIPKEHKWITAVLKVELNQI